ncbi:MAG: hypothetical protein WD898_01345 [Candidatus Paceibacterota bacterium]
MSSTKIINVLKNDSFDDVFDYFKNLEAEDVIFIFPRGSRFAKQEQHFEALKREASSSGKRISIMTSDPAVISLAAVNDMDILESNEPARRSSPAEKTIDEKTPVEIRAEIEEEETETPEEVEDSILPDEEQVQPQAEAAMFEEEDSYNEAALPEVILTAARTRKKQVAEEVGEEYEESDQRVIKDIIRNESESTVKIKEAKEPTFKLDIKSETPEDSKSTKELEKIWGGKREKAKDLFVNPAKRLKASNFFKKTPLLVTAGAVVILGLILYGTLGSAQITIVPQKQNLNFQLNVAASSTATEVSADFNRIPGQRFTDQKEASDIFPATGQKEVVQKASGEITIFNKSSVAQRLVATTRFETPAGLVYRIPQTLTVPAAQGGTPGSIKSPVSADRPGPEYNIGPTTFTVPGLKGSPKFDDFYAESSAPMAGGIIGPSKIVTEEDFTKAQEALTARVREEITQSVKSQSSDLKILDSVAISFEGPVTNAKAGEAASELRMTIKGAADVIVFREADVMKLIENFVTKSGNFKVLEQGLDVNYTNPIASSDSTSLAFDIRVTGRAAYVLDTDKIADEVSGMSEDAIRTYFKNIAEIESARIVLSPFWVKKMPRDADKIKIIINNN